MSARDAQEDRRAPAMTAGRPPQPATMPALDRLTAIAQELDAGGVVAAIEAFRQRIVQGRFYVACIGQVKRGKSTLLSALVGQPVLPTGIVPVTSVPTVLQYGTVPAALIRFAGGETRPTPLTDLEAYVSEARNPENVLGVEVVEVFLPTPLLRDGLCLVDTPGLGSILESSTAVTRAFVPQIDAALAVIGVDPPLSGEELTLITTAAHHVRHLIVVLNKADRFSDVERREAARFAERALSRSLGRAVGPILEVSATERLAGVGPLRDWSALFAQLEALSADSGRALVHEALQRGVARLAGQCSRALKETTAALWRPIEESEQRLDWLRSHTGDLAHEWLRIGFEMDAEVERLAREGESRHRRFLDDTVPRARVLLARAIRRSPRHGPALRRHAAVLARQVARRYLLPWLEPARATAERQYQEILERHITRARDLLASARELADLGFGDLSHDLDPVEQISVPPQADPSEIEPPPAAPVSRLRWCLDLIGPPAFTRRVIAQAASRELEHQLREGAEVINAHLGLRLRESRERVTKSLHNLLQGVYEAADRAAQHARAVRDAGEAARDRELSRLDRLRRDILALCNPPAR